MSSFYIYDTSRTRIGILQDDISVQWLENYQSPGEVKIEARATALNIELLVVGNRIYNTDSDTAAKIVQVDILDGDGQSLITARAELTAKLLDYRVVMATYNVANIETGMYDIYAQNRRDLPIATQTAQGYTETTETEITWGTVLDAWLTLADTSGLGFKVVFDPESGDETAVIYKGVDRSNDTSADYVGFFSSQSGGAYRISYTDGDSNYKNVAVVAGGGEGADRVVRIVSLAPVTGENRRELYVDARDLQQTYQEATPTGQTDASGNPIYTYTSKTYTDAEYGAALDARGLNVLAEHLKDYGITCDVDNTIMQFGTDYYLGDKMPVKLLEYGIFATATVSSVLRIYESGSGDTVQVTLSNFEIMEGYST